MSHSSGFFMLVAPSPRFSTDCYHRGITWSYSIGPPGRWLPASEQRLHRRRLPFFSDQAANFPLPPLGSSWSRISANDSQSSPVIPRRSVRHGVEFPAFLTACAPASASYCHLLSSNDLRKSDRGKLTIPSLVKKTTRLRAFVGLIAT